MTGPFSLRQKCKQYYYTTLNAYDAWRNNPPFLKVIGFILLIILIWNVIPEKEISHPAGIIVPQEPQMTAYVGTSFAFKKYKVTPIQSYELKARLLDKHSYWILSRGADISPIDMLLGWGIMSDSSVLDHVSFSIMNRFYSARYDRNSAYSWDEMEPYLDNNHLVPATPDIGKAMMAARVGEIIHLKGSLVSLTGPNGFRWDSSTARGSTGDTVMSCKLFYVTQFSVVR